MNTDNPTTDFIWYARSLLATNKHGFRAAAEFAEHNRAPARTLRMLNSMLDIKAAVAAGSMQDPAWAGNAAGDYRLAVRSFMDSLRTRSAFFRMFADRTFVPVPLRERVGLVTLGATAWTVMAGQPVPATKLQMENDPLEPIKAAALMVVTDELIRNVTSAGQQLFARELKGAIGDEVDNVFLAEIVDSSTPTVASTGNDAVSAKRDLRSLLMAVNNLGNAALYLIVAPDVAKMASTLTTTDGADAFPAMSALGGEMLNLPAIVSGAVPSGFIYLVDASGIAADADTIDLSVSEHGLVELSDTPTQNALTGAGANMVSLWQTNSIGMLASTYFGVRRLRTNTVAVLTGIEWGAEASS